MLKSSFGDCSPKHDHMNCSKKKKYGKLRPTDFNSVAACDDECIKNVVTDSIATAHKAAIAALPVRGLCVSRKKETEPARALLAAPQFAILLKSRSFFIS
jgi:hypothetical protein